MRLIDADALPVKFDGHTVSVWKNDLDAAPTVNPYEWISVEDRLPKEKQQCLIFTTIYFVPDHVDDCNHYDGIEIARYYEDLGFVNDNGFGVKYWMPLPAPPTEKEN
jgi:hypothetical protein